MHPALPVFATGAVALVCGAALAGVDPAPARVVVAPPAPILSVSDPDAAADAAARAAARCREVTAHVDDVVAAAARPRRLAPGPEGAEVDPCASAALAIPVDAARCAVAAATPEALAACGLDALDAPARRAHAAVAARLVAVGDDVDPAGLAAATAAAVEELGGDADVAAALVRDALASVEDDDARP